MFFVGKLAARSSQFRASYCPPMLVEVWRGAKSAIREVENGINGYVYQREDLFGKEKGITHKGT